MERPRARWVRSAAPVALLAGLVALWVLRASFGAPASGAGHHLGTVLDGLAALVAAGFCARAASRAQCASCLLWTLAPMTWLVAPADDVAWLSPADAGRAGYLLFAAVGFWLTARGQDIRARLRLVLDGAVGAASALIVVWAVVM